MLVTRIFSSHDVFIRLSLQGSLKSGLFGKELFFFSKNKDRAGKRGQPDFALHNLQNKSVVAYSRVRVLFNSLPRKKIFVCSKLEEHADDRVNVTKKGQFCLSKERKHYMGKEENDWIPAFSSFPIIFSVDLFLKVKLIDCGVFNAVFNSISVISQGPVDLSMIFWIFFF